MKPRDTDPSVTRALVSLAEDPSPGETGVRYRLTHSRRRLTITPAGPDEVVVGVGCRRERFTAAEALEIAQDLIEAAEEATVGRT